MRSGGDTALRVGAGRQLWPGELVLAQETEGEVELAFPEPVSRGNSIYEIKFRTKVFLQSTTFTAELEQASQPGRVQLVSDGDASSLISSQSLVVVSDLERTRLLKDVAVVPKVFTPNGDGINDHTEIELAIFHLEGAKQLRVAIYDLSGRRSARSVERHRASQRRTAHRVGRPRRSRHSGAAWDIPSEGWGCRRQRCDRDTRFEIGTRGLLMRRASGLSSCSGHLSLRATTFVHWGIGGRVYTHGETFEMDYVSPAIHKWYGPRYLPETYMAPWYDQGSNFARDTYLRYISLILEGDETYDTFGTPLGRGWLVYNWQQEQPGARGSFIDKRRGGLSALDLMANQRPAYRDFFSRLVIASDQRGASSYRLMIGDEIATRFTPLTFNKPRFNGVRLDYAAERYEASLLLSRPSNPDEEEQTNSTTVMGSHLEYQAGTGGNFGLTYVNAHNVLTQVEFDEGNPLHGILTSLENQPLDKLWVRIRDDSPGSGQRRSGAGGFRHRHGRY